MGVTKRGDFLALKRDARRAQEQGIKAVTRLGLRNVRRETPRRTGRLRSRWQMQARGMTGVLGNDAPYAAEVALGPKSGPISARQNTGFHERGMNRTQRRIDRLFRGSFQRTFG